MKPPDERPPLRSGAHPTLVFVVPRLARGGMLSVMEAAWAHLGGHRIVVVTQEHSTVEVEHETIRLPRALGDPLRFPGCWIYAVRVARATAAIARSAPGSVVLVPQDALATGAGAVLAGRRTRTPVVVMDHGSAIVYRTGFFWRERLSRERRSERLREPLLRLSLRILHRLTLRGADRFLLPSSEALGRFAEDGVPPGRLVRYHVPLDLERFRPPDAAARERTRERLGIEPGRTLAVAVSRLTPEKGLELLVEAFARLPPEQRPALVIGGTGPLRERVERRAAELGVELRMLGEVVAAELADLLGAADLFVYASRQGTNVPVAILEAMACGRVVLATDQPPAVDELLADGRGIVVPAGDVDAYASALGQAVAMGDERRRLAGDAARRWVEVEHGPERLVGELARALR